MGIFIHVSRLFLVYKDTKNYLIMWILPVYFNLIYHLGGLIAARYCNFQKNVVILHRNS